MPIHPPPHHPWDKLKLRQAVKYYHHSLVSWWWICASICGSLIRFITPLLWTVPVTQPVPAGATINLEKAHFPMHKTHRRGEPTLSMGTPCFVHDLKAIRRHLIFIKNCQDFSRVHRLHFLWLHTAVRSCFVSGILKHCLISITF